MVTYATQATKRTQFESNSGSLEYSQRYNCGPTCVAAIAGFYRGTYYGIETTRRLVTGPGTPTSAGQQRDMLIKRGVPATARFVNSVGVLHSLTDSNRRPIIIGLRMSLVPAAIRDHTFTGMHAIVILSGGYNNGVRGFWVMDPNFSPPGGIRPDPDRGLKWYPDTVIQNVINNGGMGWSVVPDNLKPMPVTTTSGRAHIATPSGTNVCNIRSAPNGAIFARARSDGSTYRVSDGRRLWSNGSQYLFWGWVSGDWAKCQTGSGQVLYIHRSVVIIDRNP
jgi:hypothetical protein